MDGDPDRPYFRPIPCDRLLPGAVSLAGGPIGFREIQVLRRGRHPEVLPVDAVRAVYPDAVEVAEHICRARPLHNPVPYDRPRIMGILNVTPDSFSDGGRHTNIDAAVDHGLQLATAGADILDVGGESTRPFADPVTAEEEWRRVGEVVRRLAAESGLPVSIDTSKSNVAKQAIAAGAEIINDVTGLEGDPAMAELAKATGVGVCAMHMQGTP